MNNLLLVLGHIRANTIFADVHLAPGLLTLRTSLDYFSGKLRTSEFRLHERPRKDPYSCRNYDRNL